MQLHFNYLCAVWLLLCASYLADALPQPRNQAKIYIHGGDDLQSAIDNASPGDQIFVSGTHKGPIVISKDDISLFGQGAHIVPGNTHAIPNECSGFAGNDTAGQDTQAGICIAGKDITFGEFKEHRRIISVTAPVEGVRVSGFEVVGFTGPNIAVIGARDTVVSDNGLRDSPTYGCITAGSTNSRITDNTVTSNNLNFIGICMDDTGPVEVSRNDISGYTIGLCLQTNGAKVEENKVKECCWGAFLDPKVEGVGFKRNAISAMIPTCFDGSSGIFVDGGINNEIEQNWITGMKLRDGNGAGIIVWDEPDAVASGNKIEQNVLKDNDVDIFVNSTGTGNEFGDNHCATSVPTGLCNARRFGKLA
ncbi:hypothetical protein KCU83_g7531, partial [Aureobasidium melanogenum]